MHLRILVVEDDAHIASLLATELGRLGHSTRIVGTAAGALAAARGWAPDIVLLDLGLPDQDGSDVLRQLRESGDTMPVICLTARDRQIDRVGGLQAGADDYIVKPFDIAELEARIQAVARRTTRAGARMLVVGGLRLMPDDVQILPVASDRSLGLTPREMHVLRQLLKHAGRVVTKQQLTDTLAALNEDIGEKTIEVYVHRLRTKLLGHGIEIVTVRGFGYLLRPTASQP